MAALVGLPERPGILIISHTEMVLGFAKRVYEIRDRRLHQKQEHAVAPAAVMG
jgi:hypothetical protein